jgi:hypothetical protein
LGGKSAIEAARQRVASLLADLKTVECRMNRDFSIFDNLYVDEREVSEGSAALFTTVENGGAGRLNVVALGC